MPYTADKPPLRRDQRAAARPHPRLGRRPRPRRPSRPCPRERSDLARPARTGTSPSSSPRQWPRERSVEHARLTPVFGTVVPAARAVRCAAQARVPPVQRGPRRALAGAARWPTGSTRRRATCARSPRCARTTRSPQTGVLGELSHHPVSSRFGRGRADAGHHLLDPVIVAGPWLAAAAGAAVAVRRVVRVARGRVITRAGPAERGSMMAPCTSHPPASATTRCWPPSASTGCRTRTRWRTCRSASARTTGRRRRRRAGALFVTLDGLAPRAHGEPARGRVRRGRRARRAGPGVRARRASPRARGGLTVAFGAGALSATPGRTAPAATARTPTSPTPRRRPGGSPACTPRRSVRASRGGRRSCPTLGADLADLTGRPWDGGPFGGVARAAVTRRARPGGGLDRAVPPLAGATDPATWVPTHGEPHTRNLLRTAGRRPPRRLGVAEGWLRGSATSRPCSPVTTRGSRPTRGPPGPTGRTSRWSSCSTWSGGWTRSPSTPRTSRRRTPTTPTRGRASAACGTSCRDPRRAGCATRRRARRERVARRRRPRGGARGRAARTARASAR